MPTTTRHTEYHANREKDAPDGSLEKDVDPEDRVDGCMGNLLSELLIMFVRTRCDECEEGKNEHAVDVPAHGVSGWGISGWEVWRNRDDSRG